MTQDTYRFAYDEANAELREIVSQFDQLQARKEQIEQVVKVLKAVMDDASHEIEMSLPADPASFAEPVPFLVQPVEPTQVVAHESYELTSEPEPAYAGEQSADPFQRRIDNALRHGLGSRDSRVLPRALNGLLSRA
jgi:hypothetical protein